MEQADEVIINVSLKDVVELCTEALPPMSTQGDLFFFSLSSNLWRIGSNDSTMNMIAGGGKKELRSLNARCSLKEAKLAKLSGFCEIEDGVFWCWSYAPPYGIVQIDLNLGEADHIRRITQIPVPS